MGTDPLLSSHEIKTTDSPILIGLDLIVPSYIAAETASYGSQDMIWYDRSSYVVPTSDYRRLPKAKRRWDTWERPLKHKIDILLTGYERI